MSALTPVFDGLPLTAELSFPEMTYGHYGLPATQADALYPEPAVWDSATGREIASVLWYGGLRPAVWRSDGFSEPVRPARPRDLLADAQPLDLAR